MNVLVIDVGGTKIKILATGQETPRKFPSGPGMTAAHTALPVLGVPVESKLNGLDSLLSIVQMPGGASLARTTDVVEHAEKVLRDEKAIEDVTAVIGLNFIDNYSQPNAAFFVVTMKPFEERKDKALGVRQVIARLGGKFHGDIHAWHFPRLSAALGTLFRAIFERAARRLSGH